MAKTWSKEQLASYASKAEAGDVSAQVYLGWGLLEGLSVQRDEAAGKAWLRKAASQGSQEAIFRLSMIDITDRQEAGFSALEKLASTKYAPALYDLGNCHFVGNLTARDTLKAIEAWNQACEQGHLLAPIKTIKYEMSARSFVLRPYYLAKLLVAGSKAIMAVWRDPHDERVLGSYR